MNPSRAHNGFSVGFKLMLDKSIQFILNPKYIMDAGSVDGSGVSLYIEKGDFICILGMGKSIWKVSQSVFC